MTEREEYIHKHPLWKEFYEIKDEIKNKKSKPFDILLKLVNFSEKLALEIQKGTIESEEYCVLENTLDLVGFEYPEIFDDDIYEELINIFDSILISGENKEEDISKLIKNIKEFKTIKKW